jgi:hypothetical protein
MANQLKDIRPWNGSQDEAFEELCCQLAEYEHAPEGSRFVRKAPPDAGIECFWKLPEGDEWGWQAKFFLHPPSENQWGQIDDSVKTALGKHPQLTSYTLCLPIDRSDPRVSGKKSFMDRWDVHNKKWQEWAKSKKMSVEFKYWGAHDVWERLSHEEHRGRSYFWLNSELFSQQWFQDRINVAIANVGPRYTAELNVDLPIACRFDGLGRTSAFQRRIKKLYGEAKRAYANVLSSKAKESIKDKTLNLQKTMSPLLVSLDAIKEFDIDIIAWDSVKKSASESITISRDCMQKLEEVETTSSKEAHPNNLTNALQYERYNFQKLVDILEKLQDFAGSVEASLTNTPAFLLVGKAGTGKTHLFCDVAKQRVASNRPTVLLLGIHFIDGEPWAQIIRALGLSCNVEEFLGALDSAAKARKARALIIIDALNEGEGKYLWNNFLGGMLTTLSKYPWISIALSVRNSYEDIVIPDWLVPEKKLIRDIHYGFTDYEYEATRIFFNYYNIVQPSIPLLVPEFRNPLFLKLFCSGLKNHGYTRIPPGMQGISFVFNFFVESVNEKLASPKCLNFDVNANLVQKAVGQLAELLANTSQSWIPRDEAKNAVDSVLPRSGYEGSLFNGMISEGILAEDRFWVGNNEWKEGIHFSYERFTDHLIANYLLERNLDSKDPIASFALSQPLSCFVKDKRTCLINRGLVEAFSIQLPERINKELFEVAPYCSSYQSVQESFVESLIWRNPECMTDSTLDCINKYIINNSQVVDKFLEALITVACNPNHPYNADFLHQHLMNFKMAERDAWWSIFLHYQYGSHGAVDRLVDWAWHPDDKSHIDNASIKLCGIALSWFLTTSNRFLRDRATKALVSIMQNRIHILRQVIRQFITVNDPYILERLFAVAYGCAMRSTDSKAIGELATDVYSLIFEKGEPPPQDLLRDYARGTIELALRQNSGLNIDIERVRPPYVSTWPSFEIPTAEDLQKYGKWEKEMPDEEWSRVILYDSIMGFEDFARYIIGTNSGSFAWSSRRLAETTKPTRQEIFESFVKSLTIRQKQAWTEFILSRNYLESYKTFRDYKKILKEQPFKQLIGVVPENVEFTEEERKELLMACEKDFRKTLHKNKTRILDEKIIPYLNDPNKDEYRFDLSIAQRWILKKVLDLGWTVQLFGRFDRSLSYSNNGRSAHKAERMGKKYQWIAYHELIARISDNFEYRDSWSRSRKKYEGPWQGYRRDVDPSFLLRKTQSETWQPNSSTWWFPSEYNSWTAKADDLEWLKSFEDIPGVQPLLEVTNPGDGSRWLVLEAIYRWEQPIPPEEDRFEIPRRDMSYALKSYIVKTNDMNKLYDWFKSQNIFSLRMPRVRTLHSTFMGEFFSSPAYDSQLSSEYGYEEWTRGDQPLLPVEVVVPSEHYLWEYNNYDCSIDEVISVHTPSKWLSDSLNLKWNGIEGEYFDEKGKLLAFDPSVRNSGPDVLLLREEAFATLRSKGYDILWVITGEKMMIGGSMAPGEWMGRLEISGVFRKKEINFEGLVNNSFDQ